MALDSNEAAVRAVSCVRSFRKPIRYPYVAFTKLKVSIRRRYGGSKGLMPKQSLSNLAVTVSGFDTINPCYVVIYLQITS